MKRFRFVRASLLLMLMPYAALANGAQVETGGGKQAVRQSAAAKLAQASQTTAATQNMCTSFAYDKNGNRLSQTTAALGAQPSVWGASTYPCFVWSAG